MLGACRCVVVCGSWCCRVYFVFGGAQGLGYTLCCVSIGLVPCLFDMLIAVAAEIMLRGDLGALCEGLLCWMQCFVFVLLAFLFDGAWQLEHAAWCVSNVFAHSEIKVDVVLAGVGRCYI